MNANKISESLGMTPLERDELIVDVRDVEIVDDNTAEADFDYARANLKDVIDKGNRALTGILQVASLSEHPRAYEVVSTIIKTLADANKDLLQLSKQRKDLIGKTDNNPQTVNNNLFVGSTAELQKMLKGASKQDDET